MTATARTRIPLPSQQSDDHLARIELDCFFKLSVDLVCVIDVDGHFSRVSPSFTDTLGYEEHELLALPLLDFVHPDEVDETAAAVGRLTEDGGKQRFHTRCRHKSGHWIWLSWQARPDATGRVYAIARDVTEERHARDQLAQRAAELELKNVELQQFAYVASHDLQEPLRTVASYADLVASRYSEVLDADGREFLAYMGEAAERMRTLIRALLEYSQLGRRDLQLETLDGNAVANRVLQDLQASISEAGVEVHVDTLPNLVADPLLFPLVLQNLVANAVRFRGSSPPRVWISAERMPLGWRLEVADNGIGIKEAHRERVFEVFKRLHPRSRYEGTGMGLALCRRIVRQHGGTIWCAARSDGGSAFRFTIPSQEHR
jgi:PAS domain S-box-containing protein